MRARTTPFVLCFLALHVSCSESPGTSSDPLRMDGGADAQAATCAPRSLETGSAEGDPNPLMVPMGGVRAGRLEAAEMPRDRTGLTYARPGDYVLANERVALIVEAARPSSGYDPWGGKPASVARVQGGRLVDAGDFNEMMLGLGRYTVATESVTVLQDGARGAAVVRAVGPMRPIPFIDEFGRTLIRADYADVNAAIDYELRPGNDYVDVYGTFDARNTSGYAAQFVTHAFFQGYRMTRFFPGHGFYGTGDSEAPPAANGVWWIDDDATSWAWQVPTGNLTQFISVSGFDLFNAPPLMLAPCTAPLERKHLGRIIVGGGPGLDGLVQAAARASTTRLRAVRVTVTDGSMMPAAGVRVHASLPAQGMMPPQVLTRATTDAMGVATLHVPEAAAFELRAYRRGDAVAGPVSVPAAMTTAAVTLAPTGSIRVVATEAGAMTPTALPVRVQVIPMGGAVPSLPSVYGEQSMPSGRLHVDFPTNGDITLRAPPGRYRVVVSRGFEYDLSDTTVTVAPGMTADVRASLRRVVETPGVMCGDFHIHTTRSPDSRDPGTYKLASAAGDGLEIPARSEHEFVSEWQSTVREMGLERWMFGITSLEFTTFAWGHFGVVPLEPDPARPNGGIFNWPGRRPPEVFADVRARREQPTLIINHPRGQSISSYFTAAGYNRMTGRADRPDMWDERFTVVEAFNDKGYYDADNQDNVADWLSFLQRGRRMFAVGSSDSHSILGGSPVGYPRTCMFLGTDDPRMATPVGVRDALANGRSTISGGAYIDVTAAAGGRTAGPGQELTGAGSSARLQVRVQAPPWVTVSQLDVVVNGTTAQTIALDASRRDPMNPTVRFRGEVPVAVPASGAWVILAVRGAELAPVHPGRNAFAVTNPVFLRP